MKIGFFADPHYCHAKTLNNGRRFPLRSYERLKEALDVFKIAKCEAIISLGDLIDHTPEKDRILPTDHEEALFCLSEVVDLLHETGLPVYYVPGNHDYLDLSFDDFAKITGAAPLPFVLETDLHRLVFLDGNFREDRRRFDIAGVEWTDAWLTDDQISLIQQELSKTRPSDKPVILIVHENLDPWIREDHQLKNASLIRQMLVKYKDDLKQQHSKEDSELSGSMITPLVIQGHYHPGADNTVDGIHYLTLPAMCEGTSNPYCILDL